MYRNAVFYFVGLLLIMVGGFWSSYFSKIGGDISFGHHFHGVSMLLWILLLIVQAWFIRTNRRNIHRSVGKVSFLLAPLVVWSALYIVLENLAKHELPFSQGSLGIFWLGIYWAFLFALFYSLAIFHRKDVQYHSRYMASTSLVFMVPGLARLLPKIGASLDIWMPSFIQTLWIPGIIAVILIGDDWRKGQIRTPWVLVSVLWSLGVLGYMNLHKYGWWTDFAHWYRGFA